LDERFGSGNFEDDDFCIRARLAGFHIRIAQDAFVHHTGSQTFKGAKIDYRQAMLRNWDLFRAKWQMGADVSLEKGYPVPKTLPAGIKINVPLPRLELTHKAADKCCWTQGNMQSATPTAPPALARLGKLNEARSQFGRHEFESAWKSVIAALRVRPFHPEAFLLLAEIALAAGDGKTARQCAQRARDLAPGWSPVKQFLCKPLKGDAKLDWLKLPGEVQNPKSKVQSLSVCLIVKNEEQFLAQCLKSVRGFAAQIVVVDTGSTDRTVEIAREFGAEIYSFAWCDDFSAARNAALEHATGDWILMLDADEELPATQHAKLVADMKNPNVIAFRLPLTNAGQENEGRSFIPRLFRNAPEVFFHGRIHEQVFPSLVVHAKKWCLKTAFGTAEILHHGYTKEMVRDRNKVERNLKLLRAAVRENPADVNLLMNLGLELVRSDDLPGGIEKYREAYELMSAQPAADLVPELREVLLTQFTSQLYRVRSHEEIVRVLNSPLARHGSLTASLHFALGLAHFELKQFSEAADQMRQCLAKRKQPGLTPINTDIHTAAPSHCLALSLAKLGDLPGAEKAFAAALTETGHVEAAKLDYAKFLASGNRPVEALNQLHEMVKSNTQHAGVWRLGGEIALSRPEFLEFARDWTAEAIRLLPDDGIIVAQRAEVLLLSQELAAALPLWSRAVNGERPPRAVAAQILCGTATAQPVAGLCGHAEEAAVSRAFVDWYRRLVTTGARNAIVGLNSRVEMLRPVLPTAAGVLDGVIAATQSR
jgi:tetratricopeptide (TPR) repeat protein/GT2 family glycosyltransferase